MQCSAYDLIDARIQFEDEIRRRLPGLISTDTATATRNFDWYGLMDDVEITTERSRLKIFRLLRTAQVKDRRPKRLCLLPTCMA